MEKKPQVDNEVVVGVKRLAGSTVAEPDQPAIGAINVVWVTIAGVKVPGIVRSTRCENSADFMEVTISFIASGYRTTDFNGPEAPSDD